MSGVYEKRGEHIREGACCYSTDVWWFNRCLTTRLSCAAHVSSSPGVELFILPWAVIHPPKAILPRCNLTPLLIYFFSLDSQLLHFIMDPHHRLINLRIAYLELVRRVDRALNTQVGDRKHLGGVQDEVLSYIQAVERVCCMFVTRRQL